MYIIYQHGFQILICWNLWNEMCTRILTVQEPNSENCLDLIFAASPCEKVIIVPVRNCTTSAIRKFMLDIPSPGSFQNIGLLIWAQQGWEHVTPCGSNWVKIKGAQLKINLCSPIVHWILIKNGKRIMMIWCMLTELLECKFHEKCLCLLMSVLFFELWVAITPSGRIRLPWFFDNVWSAFNALSICVIWFLIKLLQLLPNLNRMI